MHVAVEYTVPSCAEVQVCFQCPPVPSSGVPDHSQHDRSDRVPPGRVRRLRQPHGEHADPAAHQRPAHPPAGHLGHCLLPQLRHHHDPQLLLREDSHLDH